VKVFQVENGGLGVRGDEVENGARGLRIGLPQALGQGPGINGNFERRANVAQDVAGALLLGGQQIGQRSSGLEGFPD
jgi:hypothetical protein